MTRLKKYFVHQLDQSDCGIACLSSIIKFHGGEGNFENLRILSGSSKQGTTLLGLLNAAKVMKLTGEGLKADSVDNLNELDQPAILHVTLENNMQHYVVFYPKAKAQQTQTLTIGDPARSILEMSKEELDRIWKTKTLLKFIPTDQFEKKETREKKKREWIVGLLHKDYQILAASLFLGIIISLLGISTAIFSQKLIDDILPNQNLKKLFLSLTLVTFMLLIRSGLNFIRGFLMIVQSKDFNLRIISQFYSNILRLPKSFFDTRQTGDMVARLSDTRRIQAVLSSISGSIIIDFLVIIISIGFIFPYSLSIGLLLMFIIPFYVMILYSFNKPIIASQKKALVGYASAESNFIDTIQGIVDIKLLNKQDFFEKRNSIIYNDYQSRSFNLGKINIKLGLSSEIAGVVFIISTFTLASWLVISKELKLGEMVAILSMSGGIIPALNRLIVNNIQIQEALIAFERMYEFTSIPKESTADTNGLITTQIDFSKLSILNVSFRFPGKKLLLKTISFECMIGEMTALIGESGEGKSTLLQLIQLFYQPELGEIRIGDNNIRHIEPSKWRYYVGSIPQEAKIFSGNLLYNIVLSDSPEEYNKAYSFCEENGFGKYFSQLPEGYLTLVGEEGINLSGGQKQLVVVARVLFRNPKVLIIDEATSSMDKNMEAFTIDLVKSKKKDRITLMVTHRPDIAKHCDRITIIKNGASIQ